MIPLTGKITQNASVHELEDGKKVVHFTIAHNYYYPSKKDGKKEMKRITNYYKCSYWLAPGVAPFLTKGTAVFVWGFIHATAYQKGDEMVGQLNFHVDGLQIVGGGQRPETNSTNSPATVGAETGDDLPF